ncbi:MAG: hypothetical protein R3251_04220 [Candidatus Spechtbacterales bacterium]|nr:hypothetical protein [Candidatus Spechtbacterales bacterium]
MRNFTLNPLKWFLRGFNGIVSFLESFGRLPDEWSYEDLFDTDEEA